MSESSVRTDVLADVDCVPCADGWTLRFVRFSPRPPEALWPVLTRSAELARWAPHVPDRDLDRPGRVALRVRADGVPSEALAGQVSCVDHPVRLTYACGSDRFTWLLTPRDGGTQLHLHHTFLDPAWAADCAADWHTLLDVAHQRPDDAPEPGGEPEPGDRPEPCGEPARRYSWAELRDAYADRLVWAALLDVGTAG